MRRYSSRAVALALVISASSPQQVGWAQESGELGTSSPALCQFERSVEQGLGGTGINSSDVLTRLTSIIPVEQGIGGSGYVDDLERGLGGTGMVASNERGLGGTGIIGVVTGFASICVNGYEVHVNDQTDISIEGFAAADADLQLGQLVAVEAYTEDGALVASSVAVQVAAAGPVETISNDGATLTVAGQTILVAGFGGSADISEVGAGDWVVASGLRRADDVVAASSIVPLGSDGRVVVVSGPVRASDASAGQIGNLSIATDALPVGEVAVVRGTLESGRLVPERVSVRRTLPFTSGVQRLSVQGFPEAGPNGVSSVGGVPLSSVQTVPTSGQQPVQIEGTITPDGQLIPADTFAPPTPENGAQPKPAPKNDQNDGNGQGNKSGGNQGGNNQSNNKGDGPGNGPGNGPGPEDNSPNTNTPGSSGIGNELQPPVPTQNQSGPNNSGAGANTPDSPATLSGSAAQGAAPETPSAQSTRPTQSERPVQSERPTQVDRPARPEQPARPERPTRPERIDRPDRPDRPERPARPERPN